MIVTAALAWWRETPEDLAAAVRSWAGIADRVVAFDGSYRRYPGATIRSSDAEVEAIRLAAHESGLQCLIHQPEVLWAGQVEKRSALLQEAAKDSDWIIVVDTDHHVTTDRVAARAALEAMPARVYSVGVDFFTPTNEDRPDEERFATNWHAAADGRTEPMAVIFRALPWEVRQKHWHYYAKVGDSEIRRDYGGRPDAMIGVPFVVKHLTQFRTEQQLRDGRAFCNDRVLVVKQTGQEDDVPGLPPPVFDYDTLPYSPPGRRKTKEDPAAVIKPTADNPFIAVNVADAYRALERGFPAKVRVRSVPTVFRPGTEAGVGDQVIGKFQGHKITGKVGEITPRGAYQIEAGPILKPENVVGTTFVAEIEPVVEETPVTEAELVKRRGGRPKGSTNKPKAVK